MRMTAAAERMHPVLVVDILEESTQKIIDAISDQIPGVLIEFAHDTEEATRKLWDKSYSNAFSVVLTGMALIDDYRRYDPEAGLELIGAIRKNDEYAGIGFVAMTVFTSGNIVEKCEALGVPLFSKVGGEEQIRRIAVAVAEARRGVISAAVAVEAKISAPKDLTL